MESENHGLKTLCFPMKMKHFLSKMSKCVIFIRKHSVFRKLFSTCAKSTFPIGKIKKMESQNRVLKTLCFPMKKKHFLCRMYKVCSIFIGKHKVPRTSFRVCGNHSIPIGKVKKMESEKRVLATLCFPMKMEHFCVILPKSAPF